MDEVAASQARSDARRARAVAVAYEKANRADLDDLVIDDDPQVDYRDGGYWVAARIWVDADDAEPPTLEGMTQARWDALTPAERDELRDESALTPQLLGLEGWRVEVTDVDPWEGQKQPRRFIVGRSTGWKPCHLEIVRSSARGGGPAAARYATVRRIELVLR